MNSALLATAEHYLQQGVEAYLVDNDSTDNTLELAREYLGRNLISIERIPRYDMHQWQKISLRKEQRADEIQSDWSMHADSDEIRVAPSSVWSYQGLVDT